VTDETHRAVAPAWHTVVLLLALLGLSLAGARSKNLPFAGAYGRAPGYVLVMVVEWLTVVFIWYGLSLRGVSLHDIIGGAWPRALAILRDLGIAVAFLVISSLILSGIGHLLKATPNEAIRNALPRSSIEVVLWLLLCLTAGFCEETIFRGYLHRQFAALTRSGAGGVVLQGIAFGAGHGYQGWRYMLIISVFGILFGLLAQWRHTLRPGMLAHALQDGLGGLVGRHFLR
jgi:membrane protease YdiL (CAAX protease family)